MKKENKIVLLISILFSILLVVWCIFLYNRRTNAFSKQQISIVVYGEDIQRWENLREGAEMAANEYGVEVNIVNNNDKSDWEEQIALIAKELKRGSDGFLIAAADSEGIEDFISEHSFPYPYVYIDAGKDTDSERIITDNYSIGGELASMLIREEDEKAKIAIVLEDQEKDSINERIEGFMSVMNENNRDFICWKRLESEKTIQLKLFLQMVLTKEAVDVIVALDTETLESTVDAVRNLNKNIKIYGAGNSDQVVHELDSGHCVALAYQDEFSMGYLGVINLLEQMGLKRDNKETENQVEYRIVTRDSLYLPENEKLLFPFVK